MAQERFPLLLYRTCLVGAFIGFSATFYFICGVSGYIGSPLPNIFIAGTLFLATLFFLFVFFLSIRDEGKVGLLIWLLILLVLVAEVVLGLVPPVARDELTHHLAIPRQYADAGRIFEIPFAPYSYYPMLLDMLYTPFVKWGWDSVPKLIHGLFGFLTGILLYAYLAHRLSGVYGLLGFFFFISTPAILRLGNWAYVDLGLTFYSTSSLLCLLLWRETTQTRWLALAGLAAGFALSTKPNGVLVLFLLVPVLVFAVGTTRKSNIVKVIGCIVLFLFIAAIPFGPWAVKNLLQTGNPFFPFFGGLFSGSGGGSSGGVIGTAGLGIFAKREFFYGESWWQIAALPIRLFLFGRDDQPQYFDGVLNPILILFLPWAFKGKWVEDKNLLFAFALFFLLYAVFLTELRIRYILPIVPPLVILLVYGIHNTYLRIVHPSFLIAVIILLVTWNGIYLWNYYQKVSPMEYLKGNESRDTYLTRMLPGYPAFQYINKNLSSTSRIYLIFLGRRAYYCERDYFHEAGNNPWSLVHMVQKAQSAEGIKTELRKKGLTHLLVREDLLKRFLANNLDAERLGQWNAFVNRLAVRLFQGRGYSVYRIHD
jgi:4-amino-4-deoxy-L-arabinose transferase-like glycosyltransferase